MFTKHVRITKEGRKLLNDKKFCSEVVRKIITNRHFLIEGIIVKNIKVETVLK